MKKREKGIVVAGEIFLMISFSFAVAFLMSGYVGVVRGQAAEGFSVTQAPSAAWGGPMTPAQAAVPSAPPAVTTGVPSFYPQYGADSTLFATNQQTGVLGTVDSTGAFTPVTEVPAQYAGDYVANDAGQFVAKGFTPPTGGAGVEAQGFSGLMSGTTFGTQTMGGLVGGALLSGALWGGVVYGLVKMIAPMLGMSEGGANALALGAGVGTFVGSSLYMMGSNGAILSQGTSQFLMSAGPWIGVGVGIAIFVLTYEDEKIEIVHFECLAWEAPYGGQACERCNENPEMPCSEYRCKSLGQGCEIVNKGSEEEKCFWLDRNDAVAPKINPLDEALNPDSLRYASDTSEGGGRGFRILDTTDNQGCLTPFSKFDFGIETGELSKCRVDFKRTENFEQMQYPFGSSQLYKVEHIQELPVPNPYDGGGDAVSEIHSDGRYTLYIRCVDANGNGADAAETAFSFCVSKGPDKTPPVVQGTSINNGGFVRSGSDEVPIEIYTNEPSTCKWDRTDRDYGSMENTMSCATKSFQINADLNFVCSDRLMGVERRDDNQFYFRCEDMERNVMRESYPLLLVGTERLVIDSVGPSGTVEGSTGIVSVTMEVQTSHGAEEGIAVCGYSNDRDNILSFLTMDSSNSYAHSQEIFLPAGTHTYFFRCTDAGGNTEVANTTFSVEFDNGLPQIARVFKDGGNLKMITDEDAKCAYSTDDCNYNFDEGEPMSWEGGNKAVHYIAWDVDTTYYVKCEDFQGNLPSPDACQIIVRGSEF